jgi:hypothetical protein
MSMALFFPAVSPTRRKRRQMPWAAMAGVLSAALSIWMISQVYHLYQQRYEKKLREMIMQQSIAPRSAPVRSAPAPRLTMPLISGEPEGTGRVVSIRQ